MTLLASERRSAPPVAVGGVGGSGTRLVARLLQASGIHLGADLNEACDTLWFTLLFKRREIHECSNREFDELVRALVSGLRGGRPLPESLKILAGSLCEEREQHPASWLAERWSSLLEAAERPRYEGRWGWKEPNTHLVIERLWQRIPELKYVHVVRHGVEMAFSSNQNQLQLWGAYLLGKDGPITSSRSLAYWCKAHQRMQAVHSQNSSRMYWLDYDALCRQPKGEIVKLCRFLDCDASSMEPLTSEIRPPPEVPRHASECLKAMDPIDLAYVRSLGYAVWSTVDT